jgi:hypothetical protein
MKTRGGRHTSKADEKERCNTKLKSCGKPRKNMVGACIWGEPPSGGGASESLLLLPLSLFEHDPGAGGCKLPPETASAVRAWLSTD